MMNYNDREILKKKVIKRYDLYKINTHRFKRLLKDPIRTFLFYILVIIARIKPFKIKAKTLWGDKMTYYIPEGQVILYYGFFEANLTNFFVNYLKEGDVFIDIGAHVGYYSILCSRLVGDSGKIYSFEPTPRTFESLKTNSIGKKNIIINNYAILNEERKIKFIDYGPKFSAFNSYKNRTGIEMKNIIKNKHEIEVSTLVFDNYVYYNNIKPSFIKIDAEGAEYLILEGMKKTLIELRPMLSIEVAGEEEWQENCKKSIQILLNNNYEIFECTLEGYLKKHNIQDKYRYDNLVFVPKEKIEMIDNLIKK